MVSRAGSILASAEWVRVTGDPHLEVTYWTKGDRTLLFVVQNPVLRADGTRRVEHGKVELEIRFRQPVKDVVNERTGKKLGAGDVFRVEYDRAEAVLLSIAYP